MRAHRLGVGPHGLARSAKCRHRAAIKCSYRSGMVLSGPKEGSRTKRLADCCCYCCGSAHRRVLKRFGKHGIWPAHLGWSLQTSPKPDKTYTDCVPFCGRPDEVDGYTADSRGKIKERVCVMGHVMTSRRFHVVDTTAANPGF